MSTTTTPPPDPVELVRQLDPGTIRARLAEMERERRALLVLLRAAGHAHPEREVASRAR
ncbi:MAG TPA: hypothetical protein VFG68_05520 [Fimbriiglobus sp.]|nr:hypothetical protein [Fimbriiglobus sp.]